MSLAAPGESTFSLPRSVLEAKLDHLVDRGQAQEALVPRNGVPKAWLSEGQPQYVCSLEGLGREVAALTMGLLVGRGFRAWGPMACCPELAEQLW